MKNELKILGKYKIELLNGYAYTCTLLKYDDSMFTVKDKYDKIILINKITISVMYEID